MTSCNQNARSHRVNERHRDSHHLGMLGCAYRKRRAEQFQSIGAVNSRVIEVLALLSWLFVIAEKSFHFASGCESNQQFPGTIANIRPRVGDFTRTEDGIAGFELEALGADLRDVFTFDNVEPLILVVMQMTRGAALLTAGVFDDEQRAATVI